MKRVVVFALFLVVTSFLPTVAPGSDADLNFVPVQHGTFVIQSAQGTIYVDPVGDAADFKDFPAPDIILITDIHGDHLAPDVVAALATDATVVIGPREVVDQLERGDVLANGESKEIGKFEIEAIPMYNITEERKKYHKKGRGNGYLVTVKNQRVYISGDTEDIPEMRSLKNIDYAFICMNLPYTMTVEQAASAVLEMKPKVAIPYHYRGQGGFSDVEKFKEIVGINKEIEVWLMPWYE
jgi:L-ascorbate metabolism protein UlaG (beta-lactamase superfamily)